MDDDDGLRIVLSSLEEIGICVKASVCIVAVAAAAAAAISLVFRGFILICFK